jgi:hypothetical protein
MDLRIVNPRQEYAPPPFEEAPATGYLHLAAAVGQTLGRTPFPRGGSRKAALLGRLNLLAGRLEGHAAVRRVTVYRAALLPPAPPGVARPARYDVVALVEAESVEALGEVRAAKPYGRMVAEISAAAKSEAGPGSDASGDVHEMEARCLRSLGDVDKSRQGLFLFNYFAAEDPEVALRVWEHLSGWYVAETGLDNSTLLQPTGPDDFVFVNHARWDEGLLRFAVKQFRKRTFRSYVLANLRANAVTAMPILYRKV